MPEKGKTDIGKNSGGKQVIEKTMKMPAARTQKSTAEKKPAFVVRERDITAGIVFVAASVGLIVFAALLAYFDSKSAFLWVVVMVGSSIPLMAMGAYFLMETAVYIDDREITKRSRMKPLIRIPWKKLFAVTVQQGDSSNLSVVSILFWLNDEDYVIFLNSEEMSLFNFKRVVSELRKACGRKSVSFENRSLLFERKVI